MAQWLGTRQGVFKAMTQVPYTKSSVNISTETRQRLKDDTGSEGEEFPYRMHGICHCEASEFVSKP